MVRRMVRQATELDERELRMVDARMRFLIRAELERARYRYDALRNTHVRP